MILGQDWFDKLLPEGLPVPSSTIISGPGGSGKPLIGAAILAAWLRHGGSALMFLINSDRTYAEHLLALYGISHSEYLSKIVFVDFDPNVNSIEHIQSDLIKVNILRPELFEKSIETGLGLLHSSKQDVMLYGAALNILFFSPTWGDKIFVKWKEILSQREQITSVFSVSTNAFWEKVEQLEELADNLMYSRMEKPMRLHFRVARIRGGQFETEEVEVPLTEKTLSNLKKETNSVRKHLIPIVSGI